MTVELMDNEKNWRDYATQDAGQTNHDTPALWRQEISRQELNELLEQLEQQRGSKTNWATHMVSSFVTALVVAVLFFVYFNVIKHPDSTDNDPVIDIKPATIVEESMNTWMQELDRVFMEAAEKVQQDAWKSNVEFARDFEPQLTSLREQHFRPVNQLLQNNLGDEQWSNERAAALFSEIAKGFRRAGK